MESMLNFITKFTNVVKNHIEETKEIVGKDLVDSGANRSGICVDKIKIAYGARFSLLGHRYSKEEERMIDSFSEDVLVFKGGNAKHFFVPVSEINAIGQSVILVRPSLNMPEISTSEGRKLEAYRKFFTTKESIKKVLPKVENGIKRKSVKRKLTSLFH